MNILVVSSIFPNPNHMTRGVYVYRRIREMLPLADIEVVAPVPYFPGLQRLSRYAHRAAIPSRAVLDGVRVFYPRYFSVPGTLKRLDTYSMLRTLKRTMRRLSFQPDVVDAHFAVPDGHAATLLARSLGVPVGVSLRGYDVNRLPHEQPHRLPQLRSVLRNADALFAVSEGLRRRAVELGAPARRTQIVLNGVDAALFSPRNRNAARKRCGLAPTDRVLLSVGRLNPNKRFATVIEALAILRRKDPSSPRLVIVGGEEPGGNHERELRQIGRKLGVEDLLTFPGKQTQHELADWYAAADLFVLASLIEGRPNVVLEALACGRPVIAARPCWGVPELVPDESYGLLVERGDAEEFAVAFETALKRPWDPQHIARFAHSFTWQAAANEVIETYKRLLNSRTADRSAHPDSSALSL